MRSVFEDPLPSTTQLLADVAAAARWCAETTAHTDRRTAYRKLQSAAEMHAARWLHAHPEEDQ